MTPDYHKVYEVLYAEYPYEIVKDYRYRRFAPVNEFYLVRTVRRFIDKADKNDQLRADAKYFLLINFHQMIIKPLLEGRFLSSNGSYDASKLEDDIQSDIELIVSSSTSSLESRLEPTGERTSGHAVIHSIDSLWRQLKTTRLDLWG